MPLRVCVLNVYGNRESSQCIMLLLTCFFFVLFYVHGKHLRSCRDGQLT